MCEEQLIASCLQRARASHCRIQCNLFMYAQIKKSIMTSDSRSWYFSIGKQDFGGNIEYREYGDLPSENEYSGIKSITFSVDSSDEGKLKEFPGFIGELPNLKSLTIPIDWLSEIEVPLNIEVLNLSPPVSKFDGQHQWPSGLILNDLKYLAIPELVKPYIFNVQCFQNIEWIDYDLAPEKNTNKINELSRLNNLKHLIFRHAKNLDIFPIFFDHKIETLELFACTGKSFSIEKAIELKGLKSLYINNISVVFDCHALLELAELEELSLLNVKNVINVESLLEHKRIEAISIKSCGNPFKETGKDAFFEKGYGSLVIDCA